MSHSAVSRSQMGEQLKMFMSPDELIDSTNKLDSRFYDPYDNKASAGPRAQWEHPSSGYGGSLKEFKNADFDLSPRHIQAFDHPSWDTTPPVELTHYRKGRPLLTEGHHRLALAEARKIPFIAVVHHRGEV